MQRTSLRRRSSTTISSLLQIKKISFDDAVRLYDADSAEVISELAETPKESGQITAYERGQLIDTVVREKLTCR